MNALLEDGLIQRSEDEKLARHFHDIFGLSETAAQIAADGRDRSSPRLVSEVSVTAGPEPGITIV